MARCTKPNRSSASPTGSTPTPAARPKTTSRTSKITEVLATLLFLAAGPAHAADAAVATKVDLGQAKTIRLRSIPSGTVIAVRISTSGRILVSLVGLKHIKQPQPGSKPLFRASAQERLSFRVTAPEADDYVLVLSNRGGAEAVSVQAEIRTVRGGDKRDYELRSAATSARS